jgi:hypothetical protein
LLYTTLICDTGILDFLGFIVLFGDAAVNPLAMFAASLCPVHKLAPVAKEKKQARDENMKQVPP